MRRRQQRVRAHLEGHARELAPEVRQPLQSADGVSVSERALPPRPSLPADLFCNLHGNQVDLIEQKNDALARILAQEGSLHSARAAALRA